MSATETVSRPSSAERDELAPKRRRFGPHPVIFSVLLIAVAACVNSLINRLDDSWDRQPLRAIEAAAENSDQPIGVITESLADRWSATMGPAERVLETHLGPGNHYLEPIYYARHDNDLLFEETSDRCYYLAVQPRKTFDAGEVSGIMQICYLDPYKTPQSAGYVSILD